MFRTNKVPAIEERTVSGSIVSFNSAFALPLKACKVSFSATQAGSGEPSPSNPRAISGVSAIGLTANLTPVSVSLGDTRYGGELDVVSGVLTINFLLYEITGTERFSSTGSGQHVLTAPNLSALGAKSFPIMDKASMICEFAPTKSYNSLNVAGVTDGIGIGASYMIIGSEQYDNWSNLVGKKFIYELATPFDIQLTPQQIETIIGNNTIFADTGDIDLTYNDLDIAKRGNFREVFRLPS